MRLGSMVIAGAVCVAWASAALGLGLRGLVIANGGSSATPGVSGAYRLYGTAGQCAVRPSQGGGSTLCTGYWCFGGPRVLAVDPHGTLPAEFMLGPTTPNPTRGEAEFNLALPRPAVVTLSVYDVAGRQIGDPLNRRFEAGEQRLSWRAPRGGAGVYFMRLEVDGSLKARRTIVMVR